LDKENRRLGFEEDLITHDELWEELKRHYRLCDLKKGLEKAKEIIEPILNHLRGVQMKVRWKERVKIFGFHRCNYFSGAQDE
jgi:hypothetical protein